MTNWAGSPRRFSWALTLADLAFFKAGGIARGTVGFHETTLVRRVFRALSMLITSLNKPLLGLWFFRANKFLVILSTHSRLKNILHFLLLFFELGVSRLAARSLNDVI